MDLRIGTRYRLKKQIGEGSFGKIYAGENSVTHDQVAIKLESSNLHPPQLLPESKIYRILAGATGVPNFYWYGIEGDYNCMVIELLGKSLEQLFVERNHHFSMKTVLMLADQMISRIEYMHHKSYLHRDIKPDNFIIGVGSKSNLVYLLDFGLSKSYRNPRTHQHIPFIEGKSLTGTARYASINTHLGIEQSRRDDLEGLAYVLIYLAKGSLPWQGIRIENRKQKYEMINEKKIAIPIEKLCSDLPPVFGQFLQMCRNLDFQDTPKYSTYRQMFRETLLSLGYIYDYQYDWVIAESSSHSSILSEEPPEPSESEDIPIIFESPMKDASASPPSADQPLLSPKVNRPIRMTEIHAAAPSAPVLISTVGKRPRIIGKATKPRVPNWLQPPGVRSPLKTNRTRY